MNPPKHHKEKLSRVYLDDYPITLMGDEAMPPLSRIVRAGGKRPDSVDVVYLVSPGDASGKVVAPEEIIDRTAEPARPIYLRTVPKDVKPGMTATRGRDTPIHSRSNVPAADTDPVISQLGREPRALPHEDRRPPHEQAVFRSPNGHAPAPTFDLPPVPLVDPHYGPDPILPADAEVVALRARQKAASEALAKAEAEAAAEDRQEDERNQEDTLKDEEEADREAGEDAESQT